MSECECYLNDDSKYCEGHIELADVSCKYEDLLDEGKGTEAKLLIEKFCEKYPDLKDDAYNVMNISKLLNYHAQENPSVFKMTKIIYRKERIMFKRLCKEGYEVLNLQVKKDLTSIVMVSGNPASDYAKECIASLQKYTQPHELIIISTGISKDFNYSREMNRAAQITNGEYLCFVDDDMIFCENWLGYLIEHINSDDKIGVVGIPDLYNYIDKNGEAKRYDPQHPNDVQYVGTLMFMRRETFGNGFDEELASYYTDTDFCFAAREEGLRIDVEPRCKVKHLESATQKQIEGIQDRRAKGKERFMQKWRFML